jgi:GTPase SAR1 family protein
MLQTILLGDSGVGKTSLLVQFDTGKFQTGTFSATVGIGFTVSDSNVLSNAVVRFLVSTTLFMLEQNQRNCSIRLGLS